VQEFALFNYMVEVNGKLVRLVCEPGTSWTDVFDGLDQIKTGMVSLEEKSKKRESEENEKASIAIDS
jgi:hypothetical protein